MTLEDFDAMLAEQGGVCLICKNEPQDKIGFVVDHDHQTGEVRGILCQRCNAGIGMLGDDVDRLASAIAYLTRGMT